MAQKREASQDRMTDHKDRSLSDEGQIRFRTLYEEQYSAVYTFALRRLNGSKEDALDVTAEVFATAWRRVDHIPKAPEDRLWIFGVARRILSRHYRGVLRRSRLVWRLGAEASVRGATVSDGEGELTDRLRVQAAIARLGPSDRDVLSLVLWEQLTQIEAATVLGCSVNAVTLRLRKAKGRLREELMRDQAPSADRFRSSSRATQEKEHRDESES